MKKNKVKRIIAMGLIFSTLFSMTACGGEGSSSSESSAESDASSTTDNSTTANDSAAAENVAGDEIDPLGAYDPGISLTTAVTKDPTIVFDENDPEKESFEKNRWITTCKEKLGIDVGYSWIASEEDASSAKWSTAIATGDVPDFAVVDDTVYQLLLESDMAADVTDVFNTYASEDYRNALDELNIQQVTTDGRMTALPYPRKAYHGGAVMFIRKDWLDKLGLDIPESIDDVVSVARAFKEAKLGGEDTIGLLMSDDTGDDGRWSGFMNGYGAYLDYWLEKDGELVYSDVQDEMKEALLAMQALYLDGTINSDFSVLTPSAAQEYIASGKAGIFYSTAWQTTSSIAALYENDPEAEIISVMPVAKEGGTATCQVNSPSTTRIFVSKDCENPEAVVKLLNLTFECYGNDYSYYGMDETGFMWFKYFFWGDTPNSTIYDLQVSNDIRVAETTGVIDFEDAAAETIYETYKEQKGNRASFYPTTFGEGGSYTVLYDAYMDGYLLADAFNGLTTETQQLLGDIVNDALNAAMFEVIMGADISVYEAAIESWYENGGEDITREVNEWYASVN